LDTRMVRFCQAGHPNPAVIHRDGKVAFYGEGGAPIGLMPGMEYETDVVQLAPGERFMMFSDGITECENPDGEMLDEDGLAAALEKYRCQGERALLEKVVQEMAVFAGTDQFTDDVSALIFTMP
ncbi:MAG: PP2C family protein-serine/threonine phosphatase, partial [Pseudomonadota bacterium]